MVAMLFAAVTAFVPVLAPGDAVPATRLVDQLGRPFTFPELRGRTLIVGFGYTRCRDGDACPLVAAKLAKVQALVRREPITIVELSVDPARDDPAALRMYGAMFDAAPERWRLATGVPAEVRELDERFGVSILPAAKDGQIPHTQEAVIVDARGRFADSLSGDDWSPADLVARARSVAGRSTNPLEQLRIALTRGIEAACGGGKSGVTLGAGILIFLGLLAGFGYVLARSLLPRSSKMAVHSKIVAKPKIAAQSAKQ
jgi:protein SCO1/2